MHMPVGEFAAMMQMQMLFPNTPLTLMPNESWKLLLLMHEMFMAQVAVQPPRQSSYPLHTVRKNPPSSRTIQTRRRRPPPARLRVADTDAVGPPSAPRSA
jgi:hypothetical protein